MSHHLFRLAGVLLTLYGAVGLLAGGMAYLTARDTFGQARAVTQAVTDQQVTLRQDLAQIATTTGDASTAADGFATSLQNAQQSLGTAAQATNRLADSFTQVSAVAGVQIFGVRPFGELGASLGQSSGEFRNLSTQLQATSDSLGSNVKDVRRVGGDLQEIQRRVQRVSGNVEQMGLDMSAVQNIRGLEMAVSWILIWLIVQSLAWLSAGISVLLVAASRQRARKREAMMRLATLPDPADLPVAKL